MPTSPDGVFAPHRRAMTFGLVATITLVGFEALAVATVMPEVSRDLGGLRLYGWVFSAFLLAELVGIVVAGRMADARGPALPFALGLGLFALGLVGAGVAPTMELLVVARALQGLGGGALPAVAYVAIGRGFPERLRPRMFAILSTAWVLPGLVGPALASVVTDLTSWRWVFLGLVPLVGLAGLVAVSALRALAPVGHSGEGARIGDALRVAGGVGIALGGLTAEDVMLAGVLVAAGVLLAARPFVRLVPPGTLRAAPGMPAAVLVRGVLTFAFFGSDVFVPLALTEVRGESIAFAGLVLTAATLSWTAGAWVQARLVHRVGPRRLVQVGFVVILAGIVGIAAVLADPVPVMVAIPAWGIAGFGMGLAYAPLSLTVLGAAESGREGAASASIQLCDVLGVALGAGVGGAIVALGESLSWPESRSLAIVGCITGSAAVLGAVLARRLPSKLPAATPP